jgi:hypothetical protein
MTMEVAKGIAGRAPEPAPGDPAYLKIRDLIYRISGFWRRPRSCGGHSATPTDTASLPPDKFRFADGDFVQQQA